MTGGRSGGIHLWIPRPYQEGLSGLDRRILLLASASFFFIAARMGLMTFLAIFLVRDAGIPLPTVGAAFLAENVARAIAAPFAGALSDRWGRRPTLLASAAVSGAILPLFLLVQGTGSLLLWSVLAGIAQSPFFPVVAAWILDLAPADRRQSALALNYTLLSLGYTLGVAPAGFLSQRGFHLLSAASAVGLLLVVALVAFGLRGAAPREPGRGPRGSVLSETARAARDPALVALSALALVFPVSLGLISLALPVYASHKGLTESVIGLALGLNGLFVAALALPVAARLERRAPITVLPFAAAAIGLSFAVLAFAPTFWGIVLATAIFTLGEVVFSPAIPAAVASIAPAGARGAYQGAWSMAFALGIGASLFLSGVLREAIGWEAT